MVDITGSMAGQKLWIFRQPRKSLPNRPFRPEPERGKGFAGALFRGYSTTETALNGARGTNLPTSKKIGGTTYYRSDCVVERTGTQKYTDAAPGAGQYVMAHYTTSSTGSGANKKGVCVVPSPVIPLTSDQTTVLDAIKNLQAGGGTAGHLGTAWAWYTISPNWASLWPVAASPDPMTLQA